MLQDSLLTPDDPDAVAAAQHALWYFGDRDLGVQPGHFTYRLLHVMAAADLMNRTRLGVAFPLEAGLYRKIAGEVDGLDEVRQFVKAALAVLS